MRACLGAIVALALTACTPQATLLASLVPEGTLSALLSQAERVEDANRRKIAALEQSKDWEGLARFAEDSIKRDPYTADWRLVAGYAYTQQQQHARAAESYLEAVRLQPDVTLYWTMLAHSYRAAGQPQRAVSALDNALLAHRGDPQLHWLLGETQSDLRRWHPAAAAYRSALALDPDYAPAWRGLERAYRESGRPEEAREAQRMVERLNAKPAASSQAAQPR